MSQTTLAGWDDDASNDTGASPSPDDPAESQQTTPSAASLAPTHDHSQNEESACQNCGSWHSDHYVRVMGDNDGTLWHCSTCLTRHDMLEGAGADPDYLSIGDN